MELMILIMRMINPVGISVVVLLLIVITEILPITDLDCIFDDDDLSSCEQ